MDNKSGISDERSNEHIYYYSLAFVICYRFNNIKPEWVFWECFYIRHLQNATKKAP